MRFISVTSFLLVAVITVSSASASVPHLVNYQGRLTDSLGAPLDGSYNITFSLYTAASGGSAFWTEAQQVSVSDGLFQVTFGSDAGNPLEQTDFDPAQVWLGVAITGSPEFSPRTRFMSVPYSYQAEIAQTALSTGGSGWILAGNLADLETGLGQIAGYLTTEYEYGILWNNTIIKAICFTPWIGGFIFQTVEPLLVEVDSFSRFRYGGVYYMKGTSSLDDDAATSTNWAWGLWTLDYNVPDAAARAFRTFGLSGTQVWVRRL
jgi:hypothetical protein